MASVAVSGILLVLIGSCVGFIDDSHHGYSRLEVDAILAMIVAVDFGSVDASLAMRSSLS